MKLVSLSREVVRLRLEVMALRMENHRLYELVERLQSLHEDQARIINTLRRVLRFLGFSEVNIEDEFIDLEITDG